MFSKFRKSKILLSGKGLSNEAMKSDLVLCPNSISRSEYVEDLMNKAESSPLWKKTLWEKEKLLVYQQFLSFPQHFQKTCTADM